MQIKIAEDPQLEFKTLINLMKDPTDSKKEEGDEDEMDSDDQDLLSWDNELKPDKCSNIMPIY